MPAASSKQAKAAEAAAAAATTAAAPSTKTFGASGAALDEKAVGKAVRAALRGHPELLQASRKELRLHLEKKLGDLAAWKDTIKQAAADFMAKQS